MTRFLLAAALCVASIPAFGETCIASFYGYESGTKVACRGLGPFNPDATAPYTVAHPSRACGSQVTITNLANGRSIRAIVSDRGPFVAGRCVDTGIAGAKALGFYSAGVARVRVE